MTAQQNTQWICMVRQLFDDGFGVEDIAIKLRCDISDVRREMVILRQEGAFKAMFKAKPPPISKRGRGAGSTVQGGTNTSYF